MGEVYIPNGVVAEFANYSEQMIPDYAGNPLIEALPPIGDAKIVIGKMASYPPFLETERDLDAQYRIHLVQKLFRVFQPLPVHVDLESRISRVIRQGYLPRNPINREYAAQLNQGYKAIIHPELSGNEFFRSTACGFTIVGISGAGKSVSVSRVLAMYPQVIVHSDYKGIGLSFYQICWLRLDCPFDGSVKGLCVDFFAKIDQLLGTSYYRRVASNKQSVDQMMTMIAQIVRTTGLGLLVIDEMQHLVGARGGDEKLLNFLTTLINTAGLPILLITNPKGMSVLQSGFRQARRGSGQGDMIWNRLEQDANYDILVDSLWQYSWTRKDCLLTHSMKEVLYEESQGVTDILVKLLVMAQTVTISSGKEVVTESLIRQVAREHFQLVRPMLMALKSGNMKEIARYSDISTVEVDFSKVLDQSKQSVETQARIKSMMAAQKRKYSEEKQSRTEQVTAKLHELGVESKRAQSVSEAVVASHGTDIPIGNLVIQAIKALDGSTQKKQSLKKERTVYTDDDIRGTVENGRKNGMSAYVALKHKGYVQSEDWLTKRE